MLRSYESNGVDTTNLLLLLRFNLNSTTSALSGDDVSGNGNHFVLDGVSTSQRLQPRAFGMARNGACYCSQFDISTSTTALSAHTCDRACDSGDAQRCGSTTTDTVVSVYTRGAIRIGHLAPSTEYAFHVSFVTIDGEEYDISDEVVASTTTATVPGAVDDVSVMERSSEYLELQWSAVDDTGGAAITTYQVFVNGFLALETPDGSASFAVLRDIDGLANCTLTVRAVNSLGAGPHSPLIASSQPASDVSAAPKPLVPIAILGGSVTFRVQSSSGANASAAMTTTLVVQHRETSHPVFVNAVTQRNGTTVTVFKLRHDTGYVFRAFVRSSAGTVSAFSPPVAVQTGKPSVTGKTPAPVIARLTGV